MLSNKLSFQERYLLFLLLKKNINQIKEKNNKQIKNLICDYVILIILTIVFNLYKAKSHKKY